MKRQTLLGPYELINETWVSNRTVEGEVRLIEGLLYCAEDDILYGAYDILQQTKDRQVSKWIPLYASQLNDNV